MSNFQTNLPRIARQGYVPAGPEPRRRLSTDHMLIPKPKPLDGHECDIAAALAQSLMPAERLALETIIEHAQLIDAEDGRQYLAIRATPELINVLACVTAERDEMETGGDDEPGEDADPDTETEPSLGRDDGYTSGEGDADMPAFVMDQSKAA